MSDLHPHAIPRAFPHMLWPQLRLVTKKSADGRFELHAMIVGPDRQTSTYRIAGEKTFDAREIGALFEKAFLKLTDELTAEAENA